MKKNVMLKIAAVLLVAVLLSTCAISSTFAKYSTTKENLLNDTAKVAHWGVTVENASGDLFADQYSNSGIKVKSEDVVVAPGTKGSVSLNNLIKGTPEVTGEIQYTVKIDSTFPVDNMPLVINAGGTTINQDNIGDYADYTLVGTAIPFDAGTTLENVANTFTVEWSWDFDRDSALDNDLGNAETKATITIYIGVEVVQTGANHAVAG